MKCAVCGRADVPARPPKRVAPKSYDRQEVVDFHFAPCGYPCTGGPVPLEEVDYFGGKLHKKPDCHYCAVYNRTQG